MFCTRARSCARADDAKIVRSRNAQCNAKPGNHLNVTSGIFFLSGGRVSK